MLINKNNMKAFLCLSGNEPEGQGQGFVPCATVNSAHSVSIEMFVTVIE